MNMAEIKGVVFDFNGTLFWDTHLHNQAWDVYFKKHDICLSDRDKHKSIHGKNNHDIYVALFERKPEPEEVETFIAEKEGIYQELCLQSPMQLAPGAIDFLEFLKKCHISYVIATASGIENVEFYRKYLNLDKWFDTEKIIYNDGKLKGKPAPDIFFKAFKKLELPARSVLIFEDSVSGLIAAKKAKPGKIIIVNSHDQNYSWFKYPRITHFNQVDRKIFNL